MSIGAQSKCYACHGGGKRYAGLGGIWPTGCPFCEGTGIRSACNDFLSPNPAGGDPPLTPCVTCAHPKHAH